MYGEERSGGIKAVFGGVDGGDGGSGGGSPTGRGGGRKSYRVHYQAPLSACVIIDLDSIHLPNGESYKLQQVRVDGQATDAGDFTPNGGRRSFGSAGGGGGGGGGFNGSDETDRNDVDDDQGQAPSADGQGAAHASRKALSKSLARLGISLTDIETEFEFVDDGTTFIIEIGERGRG